MASPLAMYRAVERYIVAARAHDDRDDLVAGQARHVIDMLQQTPLSREHATDILGALSEDNCPFTGQLKSDISSVILALMRGEGATNATKSVAAQQTCMHVEHFLPDFVWSKLLDERMAIGLQMALVGSFLVQHMGLTHPDENTRRRIVAIIHLARKESPPPQLAYDHVREFALTMNVKRQVWKQCPQTLKVFGDNPKDACNACVCVCMYSDFGIATLLALSSCLCIYTCSSAMFLARPRATNICVCTLACVFKKVCASLSAQDFIAAYPAAYEPGHPPVHSKVDATALSERCRKEFTPARSSNRRLAGKTTLHSTQASSSAAPAAVGAEQLVGLMQFMMGQRHGTQGIPGITERGQSQGRPLAIEDRKPEEERPMEAGCFQPSPPAARGNLDALQAQVHAALHGGSKQQGHGQNHKAKEEEEEEKEEEAHGTTIKRRPAAAKLGRPRKRPAAAEEEEEVPAKKRPAAATSKKADPDRNRVLSGAYHQSRSDALQRGATAANAAKAAKAAYAAAAVKHDN